MRSFSMRISSSSMPRPDSTWVTAVRPSSTPVDPRILRQVAEAALAHDLAARRLERAAEHLEQARLAGAVAADEADLVARHHGERGVVDDDDHRPPPRAPGPATWPSIVAGKRRVHNTPRPYDGPMQVTVPLARTATPPVNLARRMGPIALGAGLVGPRQRSWPPTIRAPAASTSRRARSIR